jgi:hypothetical protein
VKRLILKSLFLVDLALLPLVYPAAWLLKLVRRVGVHRLEVCRRALFRVGVFPIRDHYYEPRFDFSTPRISFAEDRPLGGIDWNVGGQIEFLSRLSRAGELSDLPRSEPRPLDYYLDNDAFLSGDAEYWYQIIRCLKPNRIFEVGSGHSTLMALRALRRNREDDPDYTCRHVCIEPYEAPWLEGTGVTLVREKIEDLDPAFFSELAKDDILFIDSSHVIRPQGDVLFEFLELLPSLAKGVVVHVHDIFSPRDYPEEWLQKRVLFWNEQYLLEAFLTSNRDWEVVGALNYLHHHHYERLRAVAPFLTPDREPGSFYIRKTSR